MMGSSIRLTAQPRPTVPNSVSSASVPCTTCSSQQAHEQDSESANRIPNLQLYSRKLPVADTEDAASSGACQLC
jgi:hypothetical protein